ncbi:MAG TPA: VOC family protein [Alphaproteobacteria bacterium]|nr:VOC family protein [Alphaproteobacteria bacterium]
MKFSPNLLALQQVSVNVKDLTRATEFYRDKLGLPFLFTAGNMAFVQCGTVRLMLALPEKPELDFPSSILYFQVADIQASFKALQERGVHVERKPEIVARIAGGELWLAFFRDSEGNVFSISAEVKAPS